MNRAHVIAAIRSGKLASLTRTEQLDIADALDVVEVLPASGSEHYLGAEVLALRERLAAAEQRCAELTARIRRAESALRGDPA